MSPRVVRVVPDVPALDKAFDYLVPDELDEQVVVGTVVRVELHGRRVRGWVVEDDVEPRAGVRLRPIAKITGHGPSPALIDLARWAAWRWAGRSVHFLRTATPASAVRGLPGPSSAPRIAPVGAGSALAEEALDAGRSTLRIPPAADPYPLVLAAAARGPVLVVVPSHALAGSLAVRLRRAGVDLALQPREWARGAAGAGVVIGARGAAWAPVPDLAAVVVVDEHDQAHQEESAPTWSARHVAAERARRAGVPCVWTSPCPSQEALARGQLFTPSRAEERRGWPVVEVLDRRSDDPRTGLYSRRLVDILRSGARVVCVLNRKGVARLITCAECEEPARCEVCGAAVAATEDDHLRCPTCAAVRPAICLACGAGRLRKLRLGVTRAREDLERLAGSRVVEIAGEGDGPTPDAPVLVGTEAVLHRAQSADIVAFLDLDLELLAPRFRAAEEALALVARAARLVGGRDGGGRLVLQTRLPRHEVVMAALHADPTRVSEPESRRRQELLLPPVTALAEVSGQAAPAYAEALRAVPGVEVVGSEGAPWLVRAADHRILCDALSATARPAGRLRVAVDPVRI